MWLYVWDLHMAQLMPLPLTVSCFSKIQIGFTFLVLAHPGCLGQIQRRNIHPLTPIVVIIHPLSASSICYDAWHLPCSMYVPDSLFAQSLSKISLVYLLAWHPLLYTPYVSSPNHCLLFTTHARAIATCFAVAPRLCHLIVVSLSL